MNLLDFYQRFPTEESCKEYLKVQREKQGVVCKKCSNTNHYWINAEQGAFWKCKECGSTTNLRANTIMHKSLMPVQTWFQCIHLMTSVKKSFSALEMQKQLGHKRYAPIWLMMQKIRLSMGKRDAKYSLQGTIELDDAFFEIVDEAKDNDEENKRGRGSKKQAKVLVMVESTPNNKQVNPHKKNRSMGFVKMITMDDLTSKGVNYEVKKSVDANSTILSDNYNSFKRIGEVVENHQQETIPSKEAHKKLPWVHTVISNAKRQFLGVHHSVNKKYLQNYLNEFVYKLNRRNFTVDMFDRMLIAGSGDTWN